MTPTVEAMRARADREERVYGQTGLAAMLRAGADAREECERLKEWISHYRDAVKDISKDVQFNDR